ncbi:MAG TPA: substrate-binding domain-containing protein [Chthoniobacteraceae bacterium]|nr:substrate-binding domain-containing protein [Chthoniobacteraceae bacterium]
MLPPARKNQASEKISAYLDQLVFASEAEEIRLPSVRQLAAHLGVSASTVAIVYRRLKEEGRLQSHAGSGSFLKRDRRARSDQHIRLTVNLPTEDAVSTGTWYSQLFGGLTMAAMDARVRLTIQTFDTLPPFTPTGHDVALIVPASFYRADLTAWARAHRLPEVYLNPPSDNATENFVSADYFKASERLGRAFLRAGRRRILFIANTAYHRSTSNRLRISGLLSGLEYGSDDSLHFEVFFTGEATDAAAGGRQVARYFEKHGVLPDAIYTPGDFLAIGAYRELAARGLELPREAGVVGGTGLALDRTECPQLTRITHPYEALGREIVAVVQARLAAPHQSIPGRILPMAWLGGASTTPEENTLLFSA